MAVAARRAPSRVLSLPAALALLLAPPLQAQETGVAVHVGTLGLGADLAVSITSRLGLRGGVNLFPFDVEDRAEGVDFTVSLPSPQYMLLADFYPAGHFRLSGGALISPSKLDLRGTPTEPVDIGDGTYTPQEVGTLSGRITTRDVAPYVGIGFGTPTRSRVGFLLDLGVAFHGAPELSVSASGPAASDAGFQADLDAEVQDYQDDIDGIVVYPVLSIGISVRVAGGGHLAIHR